MTAYVLLLWLTAGVCFALGAAWHAYVYDDDDVHERGAEIARLERMLR